MLRIFYTPNKEKEMKKYFVISDHHFYHKNVIRYEDRPFKDLEHMKKMLIKNHNSVVTNNDVVFFLGDVSFTNKEKTKEIITQMYGHKILIRGNHDTKSRNWYLDVGFAEVIDYPIIYKGYFILSHEPAYLNDKVPYVNIHGHTHGKSMSESYYVNVSVEQINYTPVDLDDIIEKIKLD